MTIVEKILAKFGITLPATNPSIAQAALQGELLYAIMRTETMWPTDGIKVLNTVGEFGELAYKYQPEQPINFCDDVYYERSETEMYIVTDEGVKVHTYNTAGSRALNVFMRKHYQPVFIADEFCHVNYHLRGVFKHFNIPLAYFDYRNKYVMYMLHHGRLMHELNYLNVYFGEKLQSLLSQLATKHYNPLDAALMMAESMNDIAVQTALPSPIPNTYTENVRGGTGVYYINGKLHVLNKEQQSIYNLPLITIQEIMSKTNNFSRPMMRQLKIRGLGFELPCMLDDPYYETIVDEKRFLEAATALEAMHALEPEKPLTWRDVAGKVRWAVK